MRKLLVLTSVLALAAPLGAGAQDLPAGPGKDVLMKVCTNCHGLDTVAAQRHTADDWRNVVDTMIENGASATSDQEDQIVTYLATTFPAAGATAPAGSATPNPPAPVTAPTTTAPAAAAEPGMNEQ